MKTTEFLQKVQENDELSEQLQSCETPENAYSFAKENGVTDSYEEFMETVQEMSVSASAMSEEEINAVVGGGTTTYTGLTTVTIPASASAAI